MIRQTINGQSKTIYMNVSDGDFANISPLLAGKYETFNEVASGGTSTTLPEELRTVKVSVSAKVDGLYMSAPVTIPHLASKKHIPDVESALIGVIDADYDHEQKCEKLNVFLNKAK